ncbi:MAG: ABC transporter ATP-binding protein [Bacteroidales bacterium]|nr:ABC transporter ATP-binding protein [Bacteroidales bacterium]MCF8343143.1 ABC transporter ATP-binding protein [Bacteroidales bacterium]MCF8351552.1 ABC transporter ATP-binding protein [Bacteroidales bacterium]MCF8376495.1 ABC transporter ATP-binding protein [Bacteroidales bacterium]MCF8401497.1 ABC transporter ATP-binding protein [Bacteroidales bacterium]
MRSSPNIIEIKSLNKIYKKGDIQIPAIRELDCSIGKGSFTSVIGKSGSGKSTLLNLIGGLDKADSGRILFNGKDMSSFNRKEMALHRRTSVGMIFQSFNLIHHRTALGNVMLALAFGGVNSGKRKKRAMELLSDVGLGNRMDHKPTELSGGEAQRAGIARALANRPVLLLADEPTGNLDSQTAEEIMALLTGLNKQGLSIIMVTHDQESATTVSDRVIRLKDGQIIEDKKVQI